MDGTRFDGFVRSLVTASATSRRRALRGLAGGTLAGLLGLTGVEDTAAACVKPGRKGCKGLRDRRCCRGAVCRGGTNDRAGRCVCERKRKKCGKACVDIQTDRRHCGACNKRCAGGLRCRDGVCTSKLGCKVGQNYCVDGFPTVACPGNQGCGCLTDVHGVPHCSDWPPDFNELECIDCTSNADCGPGRICVGGCGCPDNGNICVLQSCDGITDG